VTAGRDWRDYIWHNRICCFKVIGWRVAVTWTILSLAFALSNLHGIAAGILVTAEPIFNDLFSGVLDFLSKSAAFTASYMFS